MIKTFKEFNKDYREYYQVKNGENYTIRTETDMKEVVYELYDTEDYDIDYDNKIIEIF